MARSDRVSRYYRYMLSGSYLDCQPFARCGHHVDPTLLSTYESLGLVGRLESSIFAFEAGLQAAREILPAGFLAHELKGLAYCHTTIDECLEGIVPAPRLATDLELGDGMCFALAGASSCVVFHALNLFAAQMATNEDFDAGLIVAADKWAYPFVPGLGKFGLMGDGAGALVVERRSARSGASVLGIELAPADPEITIFGPEPVAFEPMAAADRVIALICSLFERTGIPICDLSLVIPPSAPEAVVSLATEQLSRLAGKQLPSVAADAHYSAADPLYMLHRGWNEATQPERVSVWWGYGAGGEIGCAVLRGES